MFTKFLKYTSVFLMAQHFSRGMLVFGEIDCHNEACRPIEQYCSQFEQGCRNCSSVCDPQSIKYVSDICSEHCTDYQEKILKQSSLKPKSVDMFPEPVEPKNASGYKVMNHSLEFLQLQSLKDDIHHIQGQQNIILILLILLLIFTAGHFTWKLVKWLQNKRYFSKMLKHFKCRKQTSKTTTTAMQSNGKDLGGTTIQNMCAINDDIERAASQIYSIGAEGSVHTVTTPISTRYPAENTTPSPLPNEYSYDNQGLVVTPVSDKPSGGSVFP